MASQESSRHSPGRSQSSDSNLTVAPDGEEQIIEQVLGDKTKLVQEDLQQLQDPANRARNSIDPSAPKWLIAMGQAYSVRDRMFKYNCLLYTSPSPRDS